MATAKKQAPKPEETKALSAVPAMTEVEKLAAHQAQDQEVVASDVLIPRLLLMQGISPLVTSRKAQIGDMIRSTTSEKLGDPEHPVDIVPIRMTSTWTMFEDTGEGQPKFRGQEPRGAIRNTKGEVVGSNEDLPWDYKGPDGEDMSRRKTITLYALIPADIKAYEQEIERAMAAGEAPDLNRTLLPVVLTFQSTSFKYAGKKCASFFNSVKTNALKLKGRMEIAPFQYLLTLTCREEKKGTNTWYVYDFSPPKSLKDAAIRAEAARWSSILSSGSVKVDDSGELDEGAGMKGSSVSEMEV